MSGVDGRKVLFFVTERLTPFPARDLFDHIQYGRLNSGAGRKMTLPGLNDFTWKDFDRMPTFHGVASSANSAGVSLVTIDAAGLAFDDSLSPEVTSGYAGRVDAGIASNDMQAAMSLLADETGGATIQGRNDLALALKGLEADWTAYYSLGYESPDAKPERRGRCRSPSTGAAPA